MKNEFSRPARAPVHTTPPARRRAPRAERRTQFADDERAQVSAELLIVIAAVLAVSVVLVTQLQKTAKTGSATLGNVSKDAFAEIRKIK